MMARIGAIEYQLSVISIERVTYFHGAQVGNQKAYKFNKGNKTMKAKLIFTSALVCGTFLTTYSAFAEKSPSNEWGGSASLGGVMTSGNSDTKNITGSASVSKETGTWNHTAFGSIYNSENNGTETANRFDVGYKLDRKINDSMYVFGRLRYDADEYGNIDGRFTGVVGLGKKFIDTDKQKLSGEIGIGAHKTTFLTLTPILTSAGVVDPNQTPLDSIKEDGTVLYGGLNYSRVLNKNMTFNSVFNFEAAENNTNFTWDNSVGIKMSDKISLSIGLMSRSNTNTVGQLGKKTDTATRFSLVYGL